MWVPIRVPLIARKCRADCRVPSVPMRYTLPETKSEPEFSGGPLSAVIAREPGAAVRHGKKGEPGVSLSPGLGDPRPVVGGPVVHHDHLKITERLGRDRLQAVSEHVPVVVERHNNADPRNRQRFLSLACLAADGTPAACNACHGCLPAPCMGCCLRRPPPERAATSTGRDLLGSYLLGQLPTLSTVSRPQVVPTPARSGHRPARCKSGARARTRSVPRDGASLRPAHRRAAAPRGRSPRRD